MGTAAAGPLAVHGSADNPLALESYLEALDAGRVRGQALASAQEELGRRLGVPSDTPLLSAEQVRALFDRHPQGASSRQKRMSNLACELRDE